MAVRLVVLARLVLLDCVARLVRLDWLARLLLEFLEARLVLLLAARLDLLPASRGLLRAAELLRPVLLLHLEEGLWTWPLSCLVVDVKGVRCSGGMLECETAFLVIEPVLVLPGGGGGGITWQEDELRICCKKQMFTNT